MGPWKKMISKSGNATFFWFIILLSALAFSPGRAAASKELTLATVNGEPVTEGDVAYMIEINHRMEDLSGAGRLDLRDYVNRVIGDVLIMQEASRMGLDKLPEVQNKFNAFILEESVTRLHDEIKGKVNVTDKDILGAYNEISTLYTVNPIITSSREKADKALKELNAGKDFKEVQNTYNDNGFDKEATASDWKLVLSAPEVQKVVARMKPGDRSGIIESRGLFYIVRLVKKTLPKKASMADMRKQMEGGVRKYMEDARLDQYLADLRKKAKVEVKNKDLVALANSNSEKANEKFKGDKRVVASVDGNELTLGGYVQFLKDWGQREDKSKIVDNWISTVLVNEAAMKCHYYDKDKGFREAADRYKDQLVKNAFSDRVIAPQIVMSKKNIEDFYAQQKEIFRGADLYQYQEITENSLEAAKKVQKELQDGADFRWILQREHRDLGTYGLLDWMNKGGMPPKVAAIVDKLKPGEFSPILQTDPGEYMIIKLVGHKKADIPALALIIRDVARVYFDYEYKKIWSGYVVKLRAGSDIHINDDAVREMEQKFRGVKKAK